VICTRCVRNAVLGSSSIGLLLPPGEGLTEAPAMYPDWVFYIYAAASASVLVAALVSIGACVLRRWALARRLGRTSFFGAIAIFIVAILMVMVPPLLGIDLGSDAASKATRLARTISELMNTTVIAFPGLLVGAVTWPIAVVAQRRSARDAAQLRVAADEGPCRRSGRSVHAGRRPSC
jgi:hypothetical protein